MKQINQYINEYIIKKKLDKPIDSSGYKYHPQTKQELINNIDELLKLNIHDFNCIDTSAITDMSKLFSNKIIDFNDIDVSGWDVSIVEKMDNMFNCCFKFDCDLSNWNISNVEFMERMFYNCKKFKVDCLENWKITTKVSKRNIFYGIKNTPSWYKK